MLTLAHQMFWKQEGQLKWVTLCFTLREFCWSRSFLFRAAVRRRQADFSLKKNIPWIRAINTNYHIGVDGLSMWLVMLTTFIMPIAVLSTWHAVEKTADGVLRLSAAA